MQKNFDFKSEIVISGISGRYPQSDNVNEFWENLIEGRDLVTEHNRYNNLGYEIPSRMGVVKTLDKFDAEFFTIHAKQCDALDPRLRKLLEVAHEAIIDAGVNPAKLQGTNTGVFVAASDSEAAPIWKRSNVKNNVYGVLGNAYSMLANRLSYTFGLNGPSYVLDTACSSSSVAIQQALLSIRLGLCDGAIVAGAHLHHDAIASYMFGALEMTSKDCKCKVFDAAADGYARAEAVVAIYICKKQVAKRSYATLMHATINNDGYKEQGITFPSEIQQEKVIRRAYEETDVDPLQVDYIEAHGTGTKVGDPEEMVAIAKVFCNGRKQPLLVGSVKSNMGHPEPVAGLCGISKVILSHIHGIIPSNNHYVTPNPEIPCLHDGRVKVVDHNQPFKARYVGVNSMGFGGTNVHILLRLENEAPMPEPWIPSAPVILMGSGRTEDSVKYYLDKALENHQNQHFVKLLHELSNENILRHPYRGYVIPGQENVEIQVDTNDMDREVWYVFTGLGSQWVGMTRDLVKFDVFRESVAKSAEYLENNGFDLLTLLNSGDSSLFDSFKNAVVSITTIQVALVDLLRSVGLDHDGIIGHSTGEVAAGYADGCLTHKQAILVSYARVRAVHESGCPPGTVASVGLTWDEAQKRCPEGVYPAIHNAKENVTIAGSPENIKAFVKQLESEGIFAKMVRSADFGFHSPLVKQSGPVAQKLLESVIPEPELRSKKWLSSSVPEHLWDTDLAKYCSPAYYVNNGLSPVYFYTTVLHLPENIVALEIAPHCFMQSILKQSLPKNAVKVGLIHVKSPDNCVFFLNALGRCYLSGLKVSVDALYEPVQFPVSSRTPNVSPLIKWDYTENWYVPHNGDEQSKQKGKKYIIGLQKETEGFLDGHSLEGKTVFPATGYLWLVWRHFAELQTLTVDSCPVVFENVRFERVTMLSKRNETQFFINILYNSGKFEVLESDMPVCSGVVRNVDGSTSNEMLNYDNSEDVNTSTECMTKEDFYKEIHIRGYGHSGSFQGVQTIDMEGKWARIEWPGHWVSFLDSIVQTFILHTQSRDLFVPTRVEKLTVDPQEVQTYLEENSNVITFKAFDLLRAGSCPGIEFRGMGFAKFNQRSADMQPITTEQILIPYILSQTGGSTESKALESCVEIAIDNAIGSTFTYTEILSNPENIIADLVAGQCSLAFPRAELAIVNESNAPIEEEKLIKSGSKVIPLSDVAGREKNHLVYVDNASRIANAEAITLPGGFLLYKSSSLSIMSASDFELIAEKRFLTTRNENAVFGLFRKPMTASIKSTVVSVDVSNYNWVESTKEILKNDEIQRIYFKSNCPQSGIVGFIKSLVKEFTPEKIRCYQALSPLELNFESPSKILQEQIRKDLLYNIYQNDSWGYFGNPIISPEEFSKKQDSTHVYANTLKVGELASLSWIQSPLKRLKEDLVKVHYSALNFRDIMLATGRITLDPPSGNSVKIDSILGLEFSGEYKGKRVFGIAGAQCLATYVDPKSNVLFDIPNHWTYEDAATVPSVYITVYLALILRGRMVPGESILIHAGSGGVGQAAIAVALSMNCKVFTTVSTQEKRNFLKARFPQLTDDSFSNSRDARDFLRHIMNHTNGRGVDLVLNSLAQEKLFASIECLAKNGRFLEIGKFDMLNDTRIGLSILLKGVSVVGILADEFLKEGPAREITALKDLVQEGINSGVITPLKTTVFKQNQLEEAFRFMAQGKHIGKVVIQMTEENDSVSIPAYPRTYFLENKTYIIIGGLGGMGFELAHWLTNRGARKIVLTSRTGSKTSYHQHQINVWEKRGVQILIDQSDVATKEGSRNLLEAAMKLGPIGGIFNTAVVLKDALFENQTQETFEESAKSKANATTHLDVLTRELAPELDYFVVFSSIVAARGNPGQTNYGYANSVMERICEQRKADGLPALAVQWGAVGDVGVVHRQMKDKPAFSGLLPQRLQSCLETLDTYLQQGRTVVSSFLVVTKADGASVNTTESLVDIAANILGIKDLSKVNPKSTLVDLGMDSLMAAELGQVLSSRNNIQISAKSYAQLTFEKLAEFDKNDGTSEDPTSEDALPKFQKLLKLTKLPDVPIYKMKSLCKTDDIIFIVHPMDGTMQMLETLVSHMDAHVYGLECNKEAPLDSLEDLAKYYLKKIQEIQPQGPYKIGGYSFGGSVAFEIGLLLEKQKEELSVMLLLDGSPRWNHFIQNFQGGEAKMLEVENTILFNLLQQYSNDVSLSVLRDLSQIGTTEEKWKYMAKYLCSLFPDLNEENIMDFMMSYMGRIKCAKVYEANGKLRAKTVLVKATKNLMDLGFGQDYGLTDICEQSVEVVEVAGNHYCFYEQPLELELPATLNNILRSV